MTLLDKMKKYNKKRKKIACSVSNEAYNIIKTHADSKGYKALNAYLIELIKKDLHQNNIDI